MIPFPLQCGQTGFARRRATATATSAGLLIQFDSVVSGEVVSDLGPNLVLAGTSALDTGVKKWGASSLHVVSGQPEMNLTGLIDHNAGGKPWRFEFWVYFVSTTNNLPCVHLRTVAGNQRGVAIGPRDWGSNALSCAISSLGASGSGAFGSPLQPLNTWLHVAVEHIPGVTVKAYTSYSGGLVGNLPGGTVHDFDNDSLKRLRLSTNGEYYLDSLLFRWFEASEEGLLYANAGYSEPSGPFTT